MVERNRPYDTFGWGVVFSDQTLGNLQLADGPSAARILDAFSHWDDIEINIDGQKIRSGGHGFCGIGRKRLLNILQERCEEVGVQLVFETDVQDDAQYPDADLIIASDGLNSRSGSSSRPSANGLTASRISTPSNVQQLSTNGSTTTTGIDRFKE